MAARRRKRRDRHQAVWLASGGALAGLAFGWASPDPTVLVLMSAGCTMVFMTSVPMICGALHRDGTFCRNNSTGLLFGCWHRQHKLQRLRLLLVFHRWDRLKKELFVGPERSLASIVSMLTILSLAVGLVRSVVG